MRLFLSAIFILCAVSAAAQPPYDMERTPKGTTLEYETPQGVFRVHYAGRDGKLYLFENSRDASKGAPLAVKNWVQRDGQTVRVRQNGETLRFRPHDCSYTIGTCKFTVSSSKGWKAPMVRVSEFSDGVWTDALYRKSVATRNLVRQGRALIDANGQSIWRIWVDEDGLEHRMKRK